MRSPRLPRGGAGLLRRRAHLHREFTRGLKNAAKQERGLLPVVVAESVNDEDAYLALMAFGETGRRAGQQDRKQA